MLALNKGFRLARLFGAKFVLDPYPSFGYVLVLVAHVVLVSPPPVQALFFLDQGKGRECLRSVIFNDPHRFPSVQLASQFTSRFAATTTPSVLETILQFRDFEIRSTKWHRHYLPRPSQ